MAFIDDIIDKAQKAGKFVADKAVDTKDYVVLEYKAAQIRGAIEKDYTALGLAFYDITKSGSEDKGALDTLITKIDSQKAELDKLNEQMKKFKKVCPSCSASYQGSSVLYCKKCGAKID